MPDIRAKSNGGRVSRGRFNLTIEIDDNHDGKPRLEFLTGQFARAAEALIRNGDRGVTSLEISNWALRLSHYIHVLRNRHNLVIETVMEDHFEPVEGRHGRYILRTRCRIVEQGRIAA